MSNDPPTRPSPIWWIQDTETPVRPVPEPAAPRRRRPGALSTLTVVTLAGGSSAWLVGRALQSVAGDRNSLWILGRASGITSYLLLVSLVMMGLVLSHPWRVRWSRPSSATRIRVHVSLAMFTLAFLVLHIVVMATDRYARVGWWGAMLPMSSEYRPVAVTLGVVGGYAGLLAGLTAAFAGRWARRVWWPVHKVAGLGLISVWLHGILAGADTLLLRWIYLGTAGLVLLLAASRYVARTPGDRIRELLEADAAPPGGR
jgi:hypothetical protein